MGIKRKLVTPLNKLLHLFNMELVRPRVYKNANTNLPQNQLDDSAYLTSNGGQGGAWFPTMDEWWELTKNAEHFRIVSSALLKDFGYLRLIKDIRHDLPSAILEFGQGFCLYLWEECKKLNLEYWAIDNFSGVDYYPQEVREEYEKHTRQYEKTYLFDGLIGDIEKLGTKLPQNHFDLICSFSVLEHVLPADMPNVLEHCHSLLKKGGCLTGTFDIPVLNTDPAIQFIRALRHHGFEIRLEDETRDALVDYKTMKWERLILENPTSVMLGYQHAEGEDRRYAGHWTTLFFKAYKE
jgi:SAM-dependent methyltransferase